MTKKTLPKASQISIVFPSSPCKPGEALAIKELLEKNRLKAKFFLEEKTSILFGKSAAKNQIKKQIPETKEFFLCNAQDRFEQLKEALFCEDSKIIWCGRGGYGSADLLPFLAKLKKPAKTKLIIGFSDITAIATFFIQNWNWPVLNAPMPTQVVNGLVSKTSQQEVFKIISKGKSVLTYKIKLLSRSQNLSKTSKIDKNQTAENLEATLVGGCLSVLANNFGTNNQLNWEDKILFLEDVDETGERLDRCFNQISRIINETGRKPKAILLGNFHQGIQEKSQLAKNIDVAILRFVDSVQNLFPVFQEVSGCLGHSFEMKPLMTGFKTKIIKINKNASWCLTQEIDFSKKF